MTASAGAILTAAEWNTNVRDAVNFLTAPPLCVMRQTSVQPLPASAFTALLFDTEDIDRDNGHSISTNTSRYTAQTAGWYEIQSSITWAATGLNPGYCGIVLRVNGATLFAYSLIEVSTGNGLGQTTSATYYCNVGDYIESCAANGTTGASNSSVAAPQPRTQLRWSSS